MLLNGDSSDATAADAGASTTQSDAGASNDPNTIGPANVPSDSGASGGSASDGSASSGVTDAGASDISGTDAGASSATPMDGGSSDASSSSSSSSSDASTSSSSSSATDYGAIVSIPSGINNGLSFAAQATMLNVFGNPGTPDPNCGTSSAALAPLMKTASVGPFRVTGFGPAVDALTRVFSAVQAAKPDLYAVLGTQGMLCVRYVRGSTTNYSNHAWGTAIDMTIGGVLTPRGSSNITQGLVDLAPFMAAESFFWGAGFSPTVDAMHFEVSNELITQWKANGTIP